MIAPGTCFPELFSTGRIGNMTLRNRILMPAMGTALAGATGEVTDRMVAYYEARARGGAAMVIVESAFVDDPRGRAIRNELGLDDDRFLAGLNTLTGAIHQHGAQAAVQLHHAGVNASSAITGGRPVGPSALGKPGRETPRELPASEISEIIELYARAAGRARQAGFDGVEIMAGGGFLPGAFLSRAYNARQDQYGGPVANRARFLREIIAAAKDLVGRDYPVWCRIYAREYIDNGLTLEESIEIAAILQTAGCDAIHVIAGDYRPPHVMAWPVGDQSLPPSAHPAGFLLPLAAVIKQAVQIPVISAGRITPEVAEASLKAGTVDLVAMGRPLIADPDLPDKVRDGRAGEVIPCILCLACRDQLQIGAGIRCSVNAATGQERQFAREQAGNSRKVMVVGGGAAGMQAAITAARRGHTVTLYEAEHSLGGQLQLAALPPHKGIVRELTTYLISQVKKLGVRIETGTMMTSENMAGERPDVIVVATGSTPSVPQIPGIQAANVAPANAVLAGRVQVGPRVVVIGGGMVGCETAECLAERGHRVTILELLPDIAQDVGPSTRPLLLQRLRDKAVVFRCSVTCEKITTGGVMIRNAGGDAETLEADSVVIATGAAPNQALYDSLQGRAPQTYLVGDALAPGTIMSAIAGGTRAGLEV